MERPARPRRRLRRRRGATAGNKENQIPPETLASAPPLRLAVERLSGAHGGAKPRWMNLDSQVNSLEAAATLAAAAQGPGDAVARDAVAALLRDAGRWSRWWMHSSSSSRRT